MTDNKITDAPERRRQQEPAALATMQRDLLARLAAASLADAVGLMVRSERHRYYALAGLEWLLLPPLALAQIMFAYQRQPLAVVKSASNATEDGKVPTAKTPPIAIAMLTWALVSPEVATKIDAQKKTGAPLRLAPQEWQSGNELRIVEAIGAAREIAVLKNKLLADPQAAEAGKGVPA